MCSGCSPFSVPLHYMLILRVLQKLYQYIPGTILIRSSVSPETNVVAVQYSSAAVQYTHVGKGLIVCVHVAHSAGQDWKSHTRPLYRYIASYKKKQ